MSPISATELRQNLAKWLDHVQDNEPVVITRQGAAPAVLVSLQEWNGWMETVHLLNSPNNAESLIRSIAQANAGRLEEHELTWPENQKPAA